MASSFPQQIETVIGIMRRISPSSVLDVGKGFGKYGFLLHEYIGIDCKKRPEPSKTLLQQSRIQIDAVESNPDYLWPHIPHLYREVYQGRIEELYPTLRGYDVVLMLDVIEHLDQSAGGRVLSHFVRDGATLVVTTPREYFKQDLYESEDEHHVSYWGPKEIASLGMPFEFQTIGPGRVFVIAQSLPPLWRSFGSSPSARAARIAKVVRDEVFRF